MKPIPRATLRFLDETQPEGKKKPLRAAAKFLLGLFSYVYLAGAILHRKFSRRRRLGCPVISVGNIVCGGAGKTPVVRYIAGLLLDSGKKPAVLSRGYMRRGKQPLAVVSGGGKILLGFDESGDEPWMLARMLPGAAVLAGRDRYKAGRLAVEKLNARCVILDDGFQHYRVARDLDIVVINSSSPFGNGRILPRGQLREKPSRLACADLIILTHVDYCDDIKSVREMLLEAAGVKPVVETVHMPAGFSDLATGKTFPAGGLAGKSAVALSGIGNPQLFEKALIKQGISVLGSYRFPDHHYYLDKEIDEVCDGARSLGAEYVVTTLKDASRIGPGPAGRGRILAMDTVISPVKGKEILEAMVSGLF